MKDSELRTRAKALALHIISVCDEVDTRKGRGVLVNQIVRSATSTCSPLLLFATSNLSLGARCVM